MRVLVSAFAFSPYRGSECSVGWNIVNELAKHHNVTVLCGDLRGDKHTYREFERYYGVAGVPKNEADSATGLSIEYIAPTCLISFLEQVHNIPGFWGVYYLAYWLWQKKAYRRARVLNTEKRFDVAHQLNMIGYREPGYLWKLDIPFFWGPVGGGPNEPITFCKMFSWIGCIKVLLRTFINGVQKRLCFRAKRAARLAKRIWVVTDADYQMVHDLWNLQCERMVEAGKDDMIEGSVKNYDGRSSLRIVWSGIHTSRKALPILLHALVVFKDANVHVDILGEGPETVIWKALAIRLGVSSLLTWHGRLPRANALDVMSKAHVLACPSIKEASSIVVIEALSLGLPVICHNACGMGIVVTDNCGFKIPLKNPRTSIDGFATAIKDIISNPKLITEKSIGAITRAMELTWSEKAKCFSSAYNEVIK